MKYIKIFICLFFLSLLSCTKFLDIKSNAKYVIPKSVEDAQLLLDDFFIMNEYSVPSWGESFTDDIILSQGQYNSIDEIGRGFYRFEAHKYYGNVNGWGKGYAAIYNSNLAIELLEKIKRTNSNQVAWNNAMGSALFYRGFYFFNLLVNYSLGYDKNNALGILGIPLRLNSNFNEISIRSSLAVSVDQVIKDLYNSIEFLPDHPSIESRPSKAAANAMLANVYLYMQDYQNALIYVNNALDIKSDLMNYSNDTDIINRLGMNPAFKRFNKEIVFYAEGTNIGHENIVNLGNVDTVLIDLYDIKDYRLELFYAQKGGSFQFRGHYSGANKRFAGITTSELFLIQAECYAVLGKLKEAVNSLDELLINRISNYSGEGLKFLSQKSLIEKIREERRKELVYRNRRFADLKRYNLEGLNIQVVREISGEKYILEPNSKKYALPLPMDLIEFTGMEQN